MSQQLFPSSLGRMASFEPRQAALLLHSMSPTDQAWILGRLSNNQAQVLRGLIEELGELGIPKEPGLLEGVEVDRLEPYSQLVSNEAAEGPWDALDKVSAASILELVKNEPAGFLARLLQIRTWSWSDAVLENLGPLKRHQIEQLMREGLGPMGSALKESLLSTLLAHVGEERSNGALQSSIVSAEARKKTALSRLWVNVLSWLPGAASNRSEA